MFERRNWLGPYIPQGSMVRELIQQLKLAYNLMRDPRVHPVTKLIPVAALMYLISPVDFVPDVVPILTQLDDMAVMMLGLRLFFEFSPPEVVHEHLKRLAERVQGDWTVLKDTPGPSQQSGARGEVVDPPYHVED